MIKKLGVTTTATALLTATSLFGATSTITGTISAPDGTSKAGATVVVMPCPKKITCMEGDPLPAVSSDSNGSFSVSDLPSGFYSVIVFHPGFAGWSTFPFYLPPGQTATIEPTLEGPNFSSVVRFLEPTSEQLQGYTRVLDALGEPPLCSMNDKAKATEQYRFLWLRSFNPPTIARLTVEAAGGITAQYKTTTDSSPPYGELAEDLVSDVVADLIDRGFDEDEAPEFPEIIHSFAEEALWDQPYLIDDGSISVDGAIWLIEGVRNGQCHVVERLSPNRSDQIHRFAMWIVGFTGKDLLYGEVY